jgi:YVTN family beta-propeller protein
VWTLFADRLHEDYPMTCVRGSLLGTLGMLLLTSLAHAGSSNSLLDVSPDGAWMLATNSDNGTVTVVDLKSRQAVREIKVGDKPEGVSWIGAGPLAVVTVYHDDLVVLFNAQTGEILKKLAVPDEPYGIVTNRAGTTGWITNDYLGLVSEIDLKEMKVTRHIKVAPYVRGLALAPDESRVYVAGYYDAGLHALDLKAGKVVDHWPAQASHNLARHVCLHPTDAKAFIPHLRSRIEVADSSGSIFPVLSVVDLVPPTPEKRRRSFTMDTFNNLAVPTNPWECALSPDGKHMYLIYAGTNDLNYLRVLNDGYQEVERVGGRGLIPINGQNPRAVRVSPDGKELYIYNSLDFEVGIYDPNTIRQIAKIKVCEPAKTPEWVRGKILFNTANPPLTSRRWIACSSCHPDGHHDGRTWQNPEGLRKTTALFGLAHTHPLHWSADRDESQDFEYTIRGRLMLGRGLAPGRIKPKVGYEPVELEEKMSGLSKDLDALAIYTNSFEYTLSPHIPAPGRLSPAAERGRALFLSADTACATCHSGPYYTDSRLQKPYMLHDVGTGADDPTEKMGPKFDTPTLLGVYRQTAYLHHGKAKTLHEVLTTFNKGDKHGKTSRLKPGELDDLVEFLKALPFEKPPKETANTVKDRIPPKGE